MVRPYNSYTEYLYNLYGCQVYRIGVDARFGCPNRQPDGSGGCAYCDGEGATAVYHRKPGTTGSPTLSLEERIDRVQRQIERGKGFVARRYKAKQLILYFQAFTNTYDTLENLKAIYDAALECHPFVELIVSTRPDCLSEPVVDLLASYRNRVQEVWVELGLQSASDKSLSFIGRNHDVQSYIRAADSLHLRGLSVCTHILLGLPYEGRADYLNTAKLVNSVQSEAVKLHNLHVCSDTRLQDWYLQGEVSTSSVRRHVEECVLLLRHLDKRMIIERLMCETVEHRLVSPLSFCDKSRFLELVVQTMQEHGWSQGDMV